MCECKSVLTTDSFSKALLFLRCIHLFYKVGLIIPNVLVVSTFSYMYVFSSFYLQGERTLKVSTNCDMKMYMYMYMCSVVSCADMKLIANARE